MEKMTLVVEAIVFNARRPPCVCGRLRGGGGANECCNLESEPYE